METAVLIPVAQPSTVIVLPDGGLRVSTPKPSGDEHRYCERLPVRLATDDRTRCFSMDVMSDLPCAGQFHFISTEGAGVALRIEDEASFLSLLESLERIEALCNLPLTDDRRELVLQAVAEGPESRCVPVVVDERIH